MPIKTYVRLIKQALWGYPDPRGTPWVKWAQNIGFWEVWGALRGRPSGKTTILWVSGGCGLGVIVGRQYRFGDPTRAFVLLEDKWPEGLVGGHPVPQI